MTWYFQIVTKCNKYITYNKYLFFAFEQKSTNVLQIPARMEAHVKILSEPTCVSVQIASRASAVIKVRRLSAVKLNTVYHKVPSPYWL